VSPVRGLTVTTCDTNHIKPYTVNLQLTRDLSVGQHFLQTCALKIVAYAFSDSIGANSSAQDVESKCTYGIWKDDLRMRRRTVSTIGMYRIKKNIKVTGDAGCRHMWLTSR
jgi:hypothetical protein